ncbi:MAG: N-carbamoyl-D-amino-acid hydrolase, partial [Acidimicrobiia bacterium]|nr:N-carbamoyl-D-amino-acid hydrolase [Acidimicrobiia bacterium]
MTRTLTIGAGQLGPIARDEPKSDVVERLISLLEQAHARGCVLVAFPELCLTTFFPRWYTTASEEIDRWFEREMPSPETKPL